jgi:hypothetical protein
MRNPRFRTIVNDRRFLFAEIELAQLLALQLDVAAGRAALGKVEISDETLASILLPQSAEDTRDLPTRTNVNPGSGEFSVEGDYNLGFVDAAAFYGVDVQAHVLQLAMGAKNNIAYASIVDGRWVLSNGYHRITQLLDLGVQYGPLLAVEAHDWASAGLMHPLASSIAALLDSDSPPTVGQFTDGSATQVSARGLPGIQTSVRWETTSRSA